MEAAPITQCRNSKVEDRPDAFAEPYIDDFIGVQDENQVFGKGQDGSRSVPSNNAVNSTWVGVLYGGKKCEVFS